MKALLPLIALTAFAQPSVDNARVETRNFAGSVESMLRQVGSGPLWAAWLEPARANHEGNMCGWNNSRQTSLHLEGITHIVVLVRIEAGKVDKLQVTSTDCRLDAGGLPYFWISHVPPQQSVAWLKTQVSASHPDPALMAIALHQSSVSDPVLDELVGATQPDTVRGKAAFWLGNTAGKHGVEVLRRMLANDPSESVRKEVIFALSQSHEPEGLSTLIDAAKNDHSPAVRSQAIFWLSQKTTNKQAAEVIGKAVNDPERQVKERAVFALSQMPDLEGIPRLIELAKSSKDADIRKKAVFWLGQSKDPRAVQFFEEVLR